jgi:hypothetical protein
MDEAGSDRSRQTRAVGAARAGTRETRTIGAARTGTWETRTLSAARTGTWETRTLGAARTGTHFSSQPEVPPDIQISREYLDISSYFVIKNNKQSTTAQPRTARSGV